MFSHSVQNLWKFYHKVGKSIKHIHTKKKKESVIAEFSKNTILVSVAVDPEPIPGRIHPKWDASPPQGNLHTLGHLA